jgi:hypothetical protein
MAPTVCATSLSNSQPSAQPHGLHHKALQVLNTLLLLAVVAEQAVTELHMALAVAVPVAIALMRQAKVVVALRAPKQH